MLGCWTRARLSEADRFVRSRPRRTTPSFEYKLDETRRLRRLLNGAGSDHPIWSVNDKDDARRWADELGLRRPTLVAEVDDPNDIDFAALPDEVVLKPKHGSTSRGVFVLCRCGADWHNATSGQALSGEAIVAHLSHLMADGAVGGPIIAEAAIRDVVTGGLPPTDWKLYAFNGEVGMITAKRPAGGASLRESRFRFFDPNWNDLGGPIARHTTDRSIAPPRHAREMLEIAVRVSVAVSRPFVRVDLYDGIEGAVFGEITPDPGIPTRLTGCLDEALGRAWERGEARLLGRLIAEGAFAVDRSSIPWSAAMAPVARFASRHASL